MSGSLYARYVPPKSTTATPNAPTIASSSLSASHTQTNAPRKKPSREPKRPKKRKLEETTAAQDGDESDVRRSKQHQNILAKFDKSIKVSEKLRELAGSDEEAQDEEEEIELHGKESLTSLIHMPNNFRFGAFTSTRTNET
jgi:hypothetical protein